MSVGESSDGGLPRRVKALSTPASSFGETSASPSLVIRMAWTSRSGESTLSRKPLAPASSAARMVGSSPSAVKQRARGG